MSLSRLKLAQALIEYDNDDPSSPYPPRNALESAIFANTRRRVPSKATLRTAPQVDDLRRRGSRERLGDGGGGRRKSLLSIEIANEDNEGGDVGGRGRTTSMGYPTYSTTVPLNDSHTHARNQGGKTESEGDTDDNPDKDYGPHGEIDLASWGLPESLIGPTQQHQPNDSRHKKTQNSHSRERLRDLSPRRPESQISPSRSSMHLITSPIDSTGRVGLDPRAVGIQPLSPSLDDLISKLPNNNQQNQSLAPTAARGANRLNAPGRTVSFGGFPISGDGGSSLELEAVEKVRQSLDLGSAAGMEEILNDPSYTVRPIDKEKALRRPKSTLGIMNRGRHVSPFTDLESDSEIGQREAAVVDGGREILREREPFSASEGDGIGRPKSRNGSIMSRGRPTSPFEDLSTATVTEREREKRTSLQSLQGIHQSNIGTGLGLQPFPSHQTQPTSTDSPLHESNPFELPPPDSRRVSRFDPKAAAHARRNSSSSQLNIPNTQNGQYDQQENRRYSNVAMLRPRTLIMPTPLQGLVDPTKSAPPPTIRGFQVGAKPLPPGALTRPDSFIGASLPTSQSLPMYAGGSTGGLSLSQKVFSSSLSVGGLRGDGFIGGAEEDGEVGVQVFGGIPEEELEEGDDGRRLPTGEEDWRPVRIVEGLSLMDRLEYRKAELKGKQRVFKGDARPSMMARETSYHSSTSPTSPNSQHFSPASARGRPVSGIPGQPLVSFDSVEHLPTNGIPEEKAAKMKDRMSKSRSVFGVDTIWAREMEKLKLAEEQDRLEAEEAQTKEEKRKSKKANKSKKGKERSVGENPEADAATIIEEKTPTQEVQNPILGSPAQLRPPTPKVRDARTRATSYGPSIHVDEWYASSDEEGRSPKKQRPTRRMVSAPLPILAKDDDGSSSESDVPLSRVFNVVARSKTPVQEANGDDSSSEEDVPLRKLMPPGVRHVSQSSPADEEEDDIPLGLKHPNRASHLPPQGQEDEDDVPLAYRHMAAAQQQQQQQAQQHQSMMMAQQQMMFNQQPNMFGGLGMGMPSMMPPMMMGGFPNFNPSMASLVMPPPQDPRIDSWRREVEMREGSVISGNSGLSRMSGISGMSSARGRVGT